MMVCLATMWAPGARASEDAPGPRFTLMGSVYTDLAYHSYSKEFTANKKDDVTTAFLSVGPSSNLRANFTSADKTSGGRFELGLQSKLNNSESVALRYAYGWWKVGKCRLYAGQTDNWLGSPVFMPKQYLGQNEYGKLGLTNWGRIYGGRNPQVGFQWESDMFGAQLALVQPNSEQTPTLAANQDLYANLPRLDFALMFKAGALLVQPGFGWSQVKIQGVSGSADDTATSFVAILPAKVTFGPFTAKAEFHYGQNVDTDWSGNRLSAISKVLNSVPAIQSNGKIEDTHQAGGFLSLEYKILPVWAINAGFGMEQLQNDAWNRKTSAGGLGYKEDSYTRQAYFISLPYTVSKNFTIHPELAYYDAGTNPISNTDYGTEVIGGLEFRFMF